MKGASVSGVAARGIAIDERASTLELFLALPLLLSLSGRFRLHHIGPSSPWIFFLPRPRTVKSLDGRGRCWPACSSPTENLIDSYRFYVQERIPDRQACQASTARRKLGPSLSTANAEAQDSKYRVHQSVTVSDKS